MPYGIYCYIVIVIWIYYTINLLSLLTDTPTLLYDYATVVEENTKEIEGLVLTM